MQGNTKEEWAYLIKSRNTVSAEKEALQDQNQTLEAVAAENRKLLRDAQVSSSPINSSNCHIRRQEVKDGKP